MLLDRINIDRGEDIMFRRYRKKQQEKVGQREEESAKLIADDIKRNTDILIDILVSMKLIKNLLCWQRN